MGSFVSKHCSGRNYNSPLKQEKSINASVSVDKEERAIMPSLSATVGRLSLESSGNINDKGGDFNAGLGYKKGGFSAGMGVSGMTGQKPNMTAKVSYSKKF